MSDADPRPLALPRHRDPHERAYGLDGLDLRLALHVKRSGGFFVEAGANDGVTQSNTLLFARWRGWRGLLVEPVPELAAHCRVTRPDSIVAQAALVGPDHRSPTVQMRYAGLMSLVRGAQGGDVADAAHVARGERLQHVATYELQVPARTLSAILDEHEITHVDLLCLDLEGGEAAALRGLDLERHRPQFMLVEAWDRDAIDEILGPYYDAVDDLSHHDVLYRRRSRLGRALRRAAAAGGARRRQNGSSAEISASRGARESRSETTSASSEGQAMATSGSA